MTQDQAIAIVFTVSGALIGVLAFAPRGWRRRLERAHEALLRIRGYFR